MLMKLLFVEDDQAIAMGLVYTLKKEGYEVVWCDHKRSALQQLDQQTFDLLSVFLMEVAMISVRMQKAGRMCRCCF